MNYGENDDVICAKSKMGKLGEKINFILAIIIGIIGYGLIKINAGLFGMFILISIPYSIMILFFILFFSLIIASDPIEEGMNVRVLNTKKFKKIFKFVGTWILVYILLIVLCFSILIIDKYASKDFIKIKGIEIPTLYKYTEYNNVLFDAMEYSEYNDCIMKVVNVNYKEDIPDKFVAQYVVALKALGYNRNLEDDEIIFLKNHNNGKVSCIQISSNRITYGVSDDLINNLIKYKY